MTCVPPTGLPPAKTVPQNSRCAYQMLSSETPHTIPLLKYSPDSAFCSSSTEGWSHSCPTSSLTKHKHTHTQTRTMNASTFDSASQINTIAAPHAAHWGPHASQHHLQLRFITTTHLAALLWTMHPPAIQSIFSIADQAILWNLKILHHSITQTFSMQCQSF